MTSLDRGTRPTADNGVLAPPVRGVRSLVLAILLTFALTFALAFATTTGVATAAVPLKPHVTTAVPGYNPAALDRALAALAKAQAAVTKMLHPKKHHQHRHQ
jgi:hypothetical protein